MPSLSRRSFGPHLCFLVLGVLIGIAIDAEFRPNHIQFWVNPVQKLSVRLQPGDKVEWLQQNTKPMGITFWGGSPCIGKSFDNGATSYQPCIIGNIPDSATYLYTCQAANPSSFICFDPQGGPRSGTTGLSDPTLSTKILDLVQRILALSSQIFGHSLSPGAPGTMQNGAGVIATGQQGIVPQPPAAAKTPATSQPIQAEVYCTSSVTHVVVPGGNPDDPIAASVNQQILWGTSATGLAIASNALTCSAPAPDQELCTVGQSPSSYTATVTGCTAAPEKIALPMPQ